MNAFYKVIEEIERELKATPFINAVTYGDISDVDLNKTTNFGLGHIIVTGISLNERVYNFSMSVLLMDLVSERKVDTGYLPESLFEYSDIFGLDNEVDVLNTMTAVAGRLIESLRRGDLYDLNIQISEGGSVSVEPFTDRFENKLAGVSVNFEVIIPSGMSIC